MTQSATARTAARARSQACHPSSPQDHQAPDNGMPQLAITVYGCEADEAALFDLLAPRLGVVPTLIEAAVSETNIDRLAGPRCISVGHKSLISDSTLASLREAGVEYISTRSVGYNHINLECAQRLGITVENVAYSPDSVADYTLMLILMLLRNVKSTMDRAQGGDYRLNPLPGRELRDLTVGVIGTGRIGTAVLDRLRGFRGRVLAYDRYQNTNAEYAPFGLLLAQCDVVTLHTPLDAATHHLLDRRRLAGMKPGALIVNTGRGPLLDTAALVEALEGGRLGGAALDVVEGEQGIFYTDRRDTPVEHPMLARLQKLPNVIITPHSAYHTDHALADLVENTLRNCLHFESRAAWAG